MYGSELIPISVSATDEIVSDLSAYIYIDTDIVINRPAQGCEFYQFSSQDEKDNHSIFILSTSDAEIEFPLAKWKTTLYGPDVDVRLNGGKYQNPCDEIISSLKTKCDKYIDYLKLTARSVERKVDEDIYYTVTSLCLPRILNKTKVVVISNISEYLLDAMHRFYDEAELKRLLINKFSTKGLYENGVNNVFVPVVVEELKDNDDRYVVLESTRNLFGGGSLDLEKTFL